MAFPPKKIASYARNSPRTTNLVHKLRRLLEHRASGDDTNEIRLFAKIKTPGWTLLNMVRMPHISAHD